MALNELMPLLREQWGIRVDKRSKLPPLAVDWGGSQAVEPPPLTNAAGPASTQEDALLPGSGPSKEAASKTRVAEEKRAKLPVRLGNSIQPIPEPKGLAKEIAERLPTRDELDLMRNAVNLPYSRVQEVKSQYLRRIYSVYDADRWTFVDICYLINLHAALSKITGEDSVELPLGNGGSRQGTMLARYWLLRSPNERAFVERRQMLDKDTRDWFDRMVSEEEIKRWLLQMDRPMERNTEKAKALDNLLRAGVTTSSVSKLRSALQTAVESGQR